MNTQNQQPDCEKKLSRELNAVLQILTADDELKNKALPHVDVENRSVNWPRIWANDFGGGHSAALLFAQAIWCDRVETTGDPFDRAFAMDRKLQIACLQALAVRWGLTK